jgi:hypothetical protein
MDVPLGLRQNKSIIEKGYDASLLQKDGFNFNGYWQYPAYSKHILSELRQDIRVKRELFTREFLCYREEIITNPNAVAIHVRRGDYLHLQGFPVQSMEYYSRAMDYLKGDYCVFSDDMQWCRDNFKGVRFIHLNEYFDFELIKLCKHQIISRSSFSWWAAHLNSNENKIVVVPKEQLDCDVRKRITNKELEIFDPIEWIVC